MGFILPNYEASCGLTLPQAYLGIDNLYWDVVQNNIHFTYSIFISSEAYMQKKNALAQNIINGSIPANVVDTNDLLNGLDNIIITKIHEVEEATEEDCLIHNQSVITSSPSAWLDTWDIMFKQFSMAEKYVYIHEPEIK